MVAISNRSRAAFPWNECNPKKKMLLIVMMLMDEEDSIMLNRRMWCHHWLLQREERAAYDTIFRELAMEDTTGFAEYMRMPYTKFVELTEKNCALHS